MADVKKFVIERDRWLRGKPNSALLTDRAEDAGKMCCLGFFGIACGLTSDQIRGWQAPASLESSLRRKYPSWLLNTDGRLNSGTGVDLMSVNDDSTIDDARREERISELFADRGVEVEFR